MKRILLLSLVLIAQMSYAQVNSTTKMMSDGSHHAVVVNLEGADYKQSEKIWKAYTKKYGKFDKDRKNKEFRAHSINVPQISYDRNFSITIKFEALDAQTSAYVFFQEDGEYLDDSDANFEEMKSFVEQYKFEADRYVLKEEIEDQQDKLKGYNKDLTKLRKKNDSYHKDIKEAEEKIRESEKNIEQNLKDQDEKTYEIAQQEKLLERLSKQLNKIGTSGSN